MWNRNTGFPELLDRLCASFRSLHHETKPVKRIPGFSIFGTSGGVTDEGGTDLDDLRGGPGTTVELDESNLSISFMSCSVRVFLMSRNVSLAGTAAVGARSLLARLLSMSLPDGVMVDPERISIFTGASIVIFRPSSGAEGNTFFSLAQAVRAFVRQSAKRSDEAAGLTSLDGSGE